MFIRATKSVVFAFELFETLFPIKRFAPIYYCSGKSVQVLLCDGTKQMEHSKRNFALRLDPPARNLLFENYFVSAWFHKLSEKILVLVNFLWNLSSDEVEFHDFTANWYCHFKIVSFIYRTFPINARSWHFDSILL